MDQRPLRCAPDIFMARADEDIVVLDLVNDRYDGLFDAAEAVRLDGRGGLSPADDHIRSELIATGLAVEGPVGPADRPIPPPRREVEADPRPPAQDIGRAAIVLSSATLKFRGKRLRELVNIAHPIRGPAPYDEARLSRLVGAARIARTWIPFEGECLQRAFLLRAYLASQGVTTDWIFGVRTWPFAAHCWLQIGDLLVGDRLARASQFTPIMRV
ncbi:lasso peptide biosynthesis B2 protein [Brevundimonas sp. NPDC092305]|uniref:lasso peptide biosynthesis B2 protein n=1 Tax=Brevundimonas sp. NPDC092305 TaxID=3363957 RepID=UPI0037FB757D